MSQKRLSLESLKGLFLKHCIKLHFKLNLFSRRKSCDATELRHKQASTQFSSPNSVDNVARQPTDSWPNSVASPTRGGLTVAATRLSMNSLSTRKSATLQQRPASLYSHIDKEQFIFISLLYDLKKRLMAF